MSDTDKPQAHWESVYRRKADDAVSWYRPHLDVSLEFIKTLGTGPGDSVIDVGAGASTLVDDLLDAEYADVTVLDLADAALDVAKRRLGDRGADVHWLIGDVTVLPLEPARYDVWHDRAVFHFLTTPQQRRAYVQQVIHSVRDGGLVVVATFGPDGPERCSGLPIMRYSADTLHAEFGGSFELLGSRTQLHTTPWGTEQAFVYCGCRLRR